jgi:molybdopterin converting factor small subunit
MKFQFSGNLLRYLDYHREIEVEGGTVTEGIGNLVELYPDFRRIIHNSEGDIRLIHRFFLNGSLLDPKHVHHAVKPDDVVTVLTPIAGG